jgi:uncharacterized membrane-anchored protein
MINQHNHALRDSLSDEVHARPFMVLRTPQRISHFALLSGEDGYGRDRNRLARLCKLFGVDVSHMDANHWMGDLGALNLRWERHAEFSTFTFILEGSFDDPFVETAVRKVPAEWMAELGQEVLVATHLVIEKGPATELIATAAVRFEGNPVAGSRVAGGGAEAWSDFRRHGDGFGRIVLLDIDLREQQAGRLAQRLLEIETYRMMALLALPMARATSPRLSAAGAELAEIIESMSRTEGLEQDYSLLKRLTALAAESEAHAAAGDYRFGAARAYYALVNSRINELRETRIEGVPTIGEFMERRLAPAMHTCETVAARQERFSERVSRASQLLRTRVDIALESQNRDLLRSMDQRAHLQLRLQQTVEGLSVVAISYYLVGLLVYVFKAINHAGVVLPVDLATGVAIPIVLIVIWFVIRQVRLKIAGPPAADNVKPD